MSGIGNAGNVYVFFRSQIVTSGKRGMCMSLSGLIERHVGDEGDARMRMRLPGLINSIEDAAKVRDAQMGILVSFVNEWHGEYGECEGSECLSNALCV